MPVVPHTRAQLTLAKATDNSSAAARCQGWPGPYALFIPGPRLKTASSAADQSQQRDGVLQPFPSEEPTGQGAATSFGRLFLLRPSDRPARRSAGLCHGAARRPHDLVPTTMSRFGGKATAR